MLKTLLAHPLTRGLDVDAPETTLLRGQIIQEKPFLRQVYLEWYETLAARLPEPTEGAALELGSGGGFGSQIIPRLITSDVILLSKIDVCLDGLALPYATASLRAIVMTNVFHHLPQPTVFLKEAIRCLKIGGVIAMIEPWVTNWSRWVYTHFHDEPFDPSAPLWGFDPTGPLSGANQALPWIVFERDRDEFTRSFPQLKISANQPMMPIRYLLSGGVSMRSLAPGWSFPAWRWLESCLHRWMDRWGMFALITLERVE